MSSENAPDQSIGERVTNSLTRIQETYNRLEAQVQNYTPSVVRVIEVVLALALLAVLAHWLHWVYIAGV